MRKRSGLGALLLALGSLLVFVSGLPRLAGAQALDHYTLIMGWLPGRCAAAPETPECAGLSLKDSAGRNLSLIGLRPESRTGGVRLRNCDPVFRIFDRSQGTDACAMPGLRLSEELTAELGAIMPGAVKPDSGQCRERQFWSSHGSCSMLSQEMFFRRAVDRAREAQHSRLNAKIAGALGGRIGRQDVLASFTDAFGPDADRALQLVCAKPREAGEPVLVEVRIFLTQIGTMRPLSGEGLWVQRDGAPRQLCPEEILVPAPPSKPASDPAPPGEEPPALLQPPTQTYDPTKPQPMLVEPDIVEPLITPEMVVE